jgi:large subunit ribosomal protein L15
MLNNLTASIVRSKKRVGRGLGSGKGKTSGRGTKGQKARGKIPLSFIGGTLPIYKKLPFRRGLGNPKVSSKLLAVSIVSLGKLPAGTDVDINSLVASGIIDKRDAKNGVKIVGNGELKVKLTVKLPVSQGARGIIERAGGEVI